MGIPDTLFLMLLALVVFGPRRLPEIGRQIGKLMYEFRKVSNDFKYQMEEELRASEEAARVEKARAILPPAVNVPLEAEPGVPPLPITAGEPEPVSENEVAAVNGEVRAYPEIQPPATGEPVAASRPFRGYAPASAGANTITEAVAEAGEQPGSDAAPSEQEAHHG